MPSDAAITPTAVTEALDHSGDLEASHQPGTYALAVAVPDDVESAHRQWLAEYEVLPGDGALEQLAASDDVAYVGASSHVYDRLMDHAHGDLRCTALLRVFDPVGVVGVWPCDCPFERERSRALALAREGWVCWTDGEVLSR